MIDKQDNQTAALPVKPAVKPRKLIFLLILTISLAAVFLYQNKSTELQQLTTESGNLIQNGDFSTTSTLSLDVNYGVGWIRNGADRFSPIMTEGDNEYLYMFSLANSPDWWMRYEQPVNLPAGNYTLSAKAKVLLDHGRGVQASVVETNNTVVAGSVINFDGVAEWRALQTDSFTINQAGDYIVRLYTEDGSQAFWDDVSLVQEISPQGKIAFASNRDNNFEIYVMDADGSDQRRLTNHLAWDYDPSFSPDSQKIVFYSYRDNNYSPRKTKTAVFSA